MKKPSLTWHKPLQGAVVVLLLCTCNSEAPSIFSMQGVEEAQKSSGVAAPLTPSSLQTPPSSVFSGQALVLPQANKPRQRVAGSPATTSNEVAIQLRRLTTDFERIKRRQKEGGEERKEYYDSLSQEVELIQKQLAVLNAQLTGLTQQQNLFKEIEALKAQLSGLQQDASKAKYKTTAALIAGLEVA
ncbi:MAG: hypothetical protein AAFQ08_02075, partial [Bacteroidota bacterium]